MRVASLPLLAIAGALPGRAAAADPFTCTPEAVVQELRTAEPKRIDRVEGIPAEALAALRLEPGRVADPGQDWNSGCIQDRKTPGTMLIEAATTAHLTLVHTVHGGFAVMHRVAIVCTDGGGPHVYRIDTPPPRREGERRRDGAARWSHDTALATLRTTVEAGWLVAEPVAAAGGR